MAPLGILSMGPNKREQGQGKLRGGYLREGTSGVSKPQLPLGQKCVGSQVSLVKRVLRGTVCVKGHQVLVGRKEGLGFIQHWAIDSLVAMCVIIGCSGEGQALSPIPRRAIYGASVRATPKSLEEGLHL